MKIMMKILMGLLFTFPLAFASDYTKQIWSHKSNHYLVAYHSKTKLSISEFCLHEGQKCEAMQAFLSTDKITLPPGSVYGGKNPAAVICSLGLKQRVLTLKNNKEDENSFCLFGDGSIISTSSLSKLI